MLCAEHFGNLGENGATTVTDELIGESTYEGISCDTAISIGSATLKTNAKSGNGKLYSLESIGICLKLTNEGYACLNIVLYILGVKELNSLGIVFTYVLLEHLNVVVFAAKTENENTCSIGMVNHTCENLLGDGLVVAKLGAAEGMGEISCTSKRRKLLRNLIYATNGVYDPNLVADANVAILANIAHKVALLCRALGFVEARLIGVLKVAGEICLYIMCMHVLACLNVAGSITDGIAVLDDILTLLDIAEGVFMTVGKINIYVVKLIY
jgi:hypothetical protein